MYLLYKQLFCLKLVLKKRNEQELKLLKNNIMRQSDHVFFKQYDFYLNVGGQISISIPFV